MVQTSSRFSLSSPPRVYGSPSFHGCHTPQSRKREKRGGGNEDGEKKFGERENFLSFSACGFWNEEKVQENRGGAKVPFIARDSVRISPWGKEKESTHRSPLAHKETIREEEASDQGMRGKSLGRVMQSPSNETDWLDLRNPLGFTFLAFRGRQLSIPVPKTRTAFYGPSPPNSPLRESPPPPSSLPHDIWLRQRARRPAGPQIPSKRPPMFRVYRGRGAIVVERLSQH